MVESKSVAPEAVREKFPDALSRVMADFSEAHGLSISSEVLARAQEVIVSIFLDNPVRVSYEFTDIDIGMASAADVAFAIATQFAHLVITNAFYEGRKEIMMGDVYLALLDVQKGYAWPWK